MKNLQKDNKKVVYIYLCADILHIGHIKFMQVGKAQGNYLIAGILTNAAIKEKKSVPIVSLKERMATVKALACVDKVVPQYTYSPLNNIKKIKPDILIESDSHPDQPANKFVESYGGKVVVLKYYHLQSSTMIKNKIIQKYVKKDIQKPKRTSK